MEENFELEEEKLNNEFVSKNDYKFKIKQKPQTDEEIARASKIKEVIDEANKIKLENINVFHANKNNATDKKKNAERKQIAFDENLNIIHNDNVINGDIINGNTNNVINKGNDYIINDNGENNIINDNDGKYIINEDLNENIINDNQNNNVINEERKSGYDLGITIEDNDPKYDEFINTLSDEKVQKFEYLNDPDDDHNDKILKAKVGAFQNVGKLFLVYEKVIGEAQKYFAPEDTGTNGTGMTQDGRDLLNMSYTYALENPDLTEKQYARLLLSLYETFKHEYEKQEDTIAAYNTELKKYLTQEVRDKLTEYANSLDENKSEANAERKKVALEAAKGEIAKGNETLVFSTLKFKLDVEVPAVEDVSGKLHQATFLSKTLPTVRKYFAFEEKAIKDYANIEKTSIIDQQKVLTFALQEQAFATKHKEFDEYLVSEGKNIKYYQEQDNKFYKMTKISNELAREFKDMPYKSLSKETIGVENVETKDPLIDRFLYLKNVVPEYLDTDSDILKLPVEDDIYRYANMIQREGSLTQKEKYELYKYLDASITYFEATNVPNTNSYDTAGAYGLIWTDLISIDGKSLRELTSRDPIRVYDPSKKKDEQFSAESNAVKILIDALVNKNQKVTISRIHSSEKEISVEVRPFYFKFNQAEYAKAYKKTGFFSMFSSEPDPVDKTKEQEALWNERCLTFQAEKEEVGSKLIKSVLEKQPAIIQTEGPKVSDEIVEYQKEKLASKNYKEEEINEIVQSHNTLKTGTIDLKLDLNESLDDNKVYDVNNNNIINDNVPDNNIADPDINTNAEKEPELEIVENAFRVDSLYKPDEKELRRLERERKIQEQKEREHELHVVNQARLKQKINSTYQKPNANNIDQGYLHTVDLKLDENIYNEENIYSRDSKYSLEKLLEGLDIDLNETIQTFDDFNDRNVGMNNECNVLKNDEAYNGAVRNLDKLTTIYKYIHSKLKDIDYNRFTSLAGSNGILPQLDARDCHSISYIYALNNPNMTVKQYAELATSLLLIYTHDYKKDEATMQDYFNDLVAKRTNPVIDDAKALKVRLENKLALAADHEKNNIKDRISNVDKFINGDYKAGNSDCIFYVYNELGIKYNDLRTYIKDKKKDSFIDRVRPSVELLENYCKDMVQNLDDIDGNRTHDAQKVIVHYLQGQCKNVKHGEFFDILHENATLKDIIDADKIKHSEELIDSKISHDMGTRQFDTDSYLSVTLAAEFKIPDPVTDRLYKFRNVIQDAVGKMEGNVLNLPLDDEIYKAAELINKADNHDINPDELKYLKTYLGSFSYHFSSLLCPNTNESATASKFNLDYSDLVYIDGKPLKSYNQTSKKYSELESKTGIKFTDDVYRSYMLIKTICKYPKKINYVKLNSTNTKLKYEIIRVKPMVSQEKYLQSNPQIRGFKERWRNLIHGQRNVEKINQDVWMTTPEERKSLNNMIASNIFKKLVTKRPNLQQIYNTNTISQDAIKYQKEMLVKELHRTQEEAQEFVNQHKNGAVIDDSLVKDEHKVEKGFH